MEMPARLIQYLKKHNVNYRIQVHSPAFTASETAEADHIPGRRLIKVVMVKALGKDAMILIPSTREIDLFKLSSALGTQDVRIEDEKEFVDLFPDCEAGAMPPFGKIYGMPCYADDSLWKENELFFNAGNHSETMSLSAPDFFRLTKAGKGDFSVLRKQREAGDE